MVFCQQSLSVTDSVDVEDRLNQRLESLVEIVGSQISLAQLVNDIARVWGPSWHSLLRNEESPVESGQFNRGYRGGYAMIR